MCLLASSCMFVYLSLTWKVHFWYTPETTSGVRVWRTSGHGQGHGSKKTKARVIRFWLKGILFCNVLIKKLSRRLHRHENVLYWFVYILVMSHDMWRHWSTMISCMVSSWNAMNVMIATPSDRPTMSSMRLRHLYLQFSPVSRIISGSCNMSTNTNWYQVRGSGRP